MGSTNIRIGRFTVRFAKWEHQNYWAMTFKSVKPTARQLVHPHKPKAAPMSRKTKFRTSGNPTRWKMMVYKNMYIFIYTHTYIYIYDDDEI